jgi:hypothetical protein
MLKTTLLLFAVFAHLPAIAGEADVLNVKISCSDNFKCDFDVTVQHADEGWEHYANKWEVASPDGTILATRVLAHPHVNEQPFTRSMRKVEIPINLSEVTVRAQDSVHGYGGKEITVNLPL